MYDVVIVGGGMVGLTFACALGDSGLRVAIVDERIPSAHWSKENVDLRVSAITTASQQIFAQLDVWSKIQVKRISYFRQMQVWDSAGVSLDFNCTALGAETLGYIIENQVIVSALLEQLKTYTNIEFIAPAKVQALQMHDGHYNVKLSTQQSITGKLLVGADGAHSQIRDLAGIEMHSWDYGQSALIATVHCGLPHQEIARQRFLSDGILAFLPLSNPHSCSIVWSSAPSEIERLLNLDAVSFAYELTVAFENRLGAVELLSERAAFPLCMRQAKKYILPQLALIGDAAHTLHPLAGQGVNLGLLDAASLAEILLTARQKNRSIGAFATLRRYERSRKSENLIMIAAIEGIKRLFAGKRMPLPMLRSLGLNMVNKTPLLKNYFMRRAMGVSGYQPKIKDVIASEL